jgi:AraC-like DNA-binding protein
MTDGAGLDGFHESPGRARQVLALAAAGGADIRRLAREAGITSWLLSDDKARVPTQRVFRLWELTEHALGDPCAGLAAVRDVHLPTGMDLLSYLFSTAGTLRDGLRASGDYNYLSSTNGGLRVLAEAGSEVTYSYTNALDGGRGGELYLQLVIAGCCRAARLGTGRPVVPLRVAFSQAAPASYGEFTHALGTSRIDFGATVTTITFRTGDLRLPMVGADPALARLLRQYAALLPVPPPPSWREHFQGLIARAIQQGALSLDAVASYLAVSPRTLQRQLAAHGTSWRAELEAARERIAARAGGAGTPDISQLARQLGYADPRAARRFLRRLDKPGQDHRKGS